MSMINTLSIADYKMVNAKLARVLVSFTGKLSADDVASEVARMSGGRANIVRNSFREVSAGKAVGFIYGTQEIRNVTENEIRANYRTASTNILMSNDDNSLWEVRKVGDNTYLAKQDSEPLDEVIDAVANRKTIGASRINLFASVKPNRNELVAFVNGKGNMDYGFALSTGKDSVKVLSAVSGNAVVANNESVVGSYPVEIDSATDIKVKKALIAESTGDVKKTMKDYYRKLYDYDSQYLSEVIKQIDALSFA